MVLSRNNPPRRDVALLPTIASSLPSSLTTLPPGNCIAISHGMRPLGWHCRYWSVSRISRSSILIWVLSAMAAKPGESGMVTRVVGTILRNARMTPASETLMPSKNMGWEFDVEKGIGFSAGRIPLCTLYQKWISVGQEWLLGVSLKLFIDSIRQAFPLLPFYLSNDQLSILNFAAKVAGYGRNMVAIGCLILCRFSC